MRHTQMRMMFLAPLAVATCPIRRHLGTTPKPIGSKLVHQVSLEPA